jgi:ABC-type Fe3+ transport system substrate-binding protein
MTVRNFIEENARAEEFMLINGYPVESKQFNRMMGVIKLDTALSIKKIKFEQFVESYEKFLQAEQEIDQVIGINDNDEKAHRIMGSLPCVIQLPLHNAFERYLEEKDIRVDFQFQGASLGQNWMHRIDMNTPSVILMSPGFVPLFDHKFLEKFDYSENLAMPFDVPYNEQFLAFKDPRKHLHVISVIPLVFVINKDELNGRRIPDSWEEIIFSDYESCIAYPNEDEDLKNALLATLYGMGGDDAVRSFARNCLLPLHPSQMVKSRRMKEKPAIMIMPYFFAKIAEREKNFMAVWPREGALSIPIFLAMDNRMNNEEKKALEFFFTEKTGTTFAKQGFFPSSMEGVDNELLGDLFWLGWDFVYANDMIALMQSCCQIFEDVIL